MHTFHAHVNSDRDDAHTLAKSEMVATVYYKWDDQITADGLAQLTATRIGDAIQFRFLVFDRDGNPQYNDVVTMQRP